MHFIKFIARERQAHILTSLIFLITTSLIVHPWTEPDTSWWIWLEPITGVLTLAMASLLWIGEVAQDEENSLPKRLTVHFHLEGREIMRCEKAYLAGEGDIRAWGQQLGSQMADNPYLRFEPLLEQMPGKRDRDDKDINSATIKLYEVIFFLTESPARIDPKGDDVINKEVMDNITQGKICVWKYDSTTKHFTKKWE